MLTLLGQSLSRLQLRALRHESAISQCIVDQVRISVLPCLKMLLYHSSKKKRGEHETKHYSRKPIDYGLVAVRVPPMKAQGISLHLLDSDLQECFLEIAS